MSVWRPLFIKCIILDHKLQRMLNDSKIGQLNSERPLHQTAVSSTEYQNDAQSCTLMQNNSLIYLNCFCGMMFGFWLFFLLGGGGGVAAIEGLRELMARLTEQFFQHPVSKLMIFPKQPSREVHLESKTESQEIYFHSHKLICIVKHIFHSHSCISQFHLCASQCQIQFMDQESIWNRRPRSGLKIM